MNDLVIWERLKIDRTELENILQCNFFDNLAIEMADLLILRQSQNKLSFLLTQATFGFIGILLLVPINLVIFQKWLSYNNQLQSFAIAIIFSIIISSIALLSLNFCLWQQAKKIKNIAIILDKITRYNRLIQNFQLLNKFNSLSTVVSDRESQSNSEITNALQITKHTLLKSLELENFVLHNQQLQSQERYQILNSLEDDLVQFMSLSDRQNTAEDRRLLAEAIDIGLSVHQELRQNIDRSLK